MTIPNLPMLDPYSPTFRGDVDAFFGGQIQATINSINSEIERINQIGAGSFVATSSTSLTIVASGTVNLTINTGKGFTPGQFVIVAHSPNPSAAYMVGQVQSYNTGTGELVMEVNSCAGTGQQHDDWTVSLSAASVVIPNRPNSYAHRHLTTTSGTITVPEGVTTLRVYAIGKGGDCPASSYTTPTNPSPGVTNRAGSGGGGGMAFGDVDVSPGSEVEIDIAGGVARVLIGGVELFRAEPGEDGSVYTGAATGAPSAALRGAGGIASIHPSVTNGGAFTGGAGGSAASPLGNGVAGSGAGIGSAQGGIVGDGNYTNGQARPFEMRFQDPLLADAYLSRAAGLIAPGLPSSSTSIRSGDFAGGYGNQSSSGPIVVGGDGGFLGAGGFASWLNASASVTLRGGKGGIGGGAGEALAVSNTAGISLTIQKADGGSACVVIYW